MKNYKKVLKLSIISILLALFFTSCSNVVNNIAFRSPANHKNLDGSTNFYSLIQTAVDISLIKIKKHVMSDEVILVSDFVNSHRLENRSKLGFLLSEQLKNSLLNRDIIVKQIELGKDFQLGPKGFNLLTRDQKDISSSSLDNNYAIVGTYSITTQNLILFIKLIDIKNGNILSSSSVKTSMDKEIQELEGFRKDFVVAPLVL